MVDDRRRKGFWRLKRAWVMVFAVLSSSWAFYIAVSGGWLLDLY